MKLSVAAAALLGPLTRVATLSEQFGPVMRRDGRLRLSSTEILTLNTASPPSPNLDHDATRRGLRYKRRMMRQVASNLKNTPSLKTRVVPCDPRSSDADVGILSCGRDRICKPSMTSPLGGVCVPPESKRQDDELGHDFNHPRKGPFMVNHQPSIPRTGTDTVQCDPSQVDIGILVCDEGQFCQDDETSALGGYCADTTISNDNLRLATYYYLDDYLYQCGSYPPEAPYLYCDCSSVNRTTGTGTMYCSQNITASLVQGCDEYVVYDFFERSFKDAAMVKLSDCYHTTAPFMESICFLYYMVEAEPVCYAEWNGQRCTSCAKTNYPFPAFNCSNVEGGRVGDSRKELLSVFDLCSNSTCTSLCADGSFIPDANFDITFIAVGYNGTCGELALFEENAELADVYCPSFMEAAQSYCCVPLNSTRAGGDNTTVIPDLDPTDNATTVPDPEPADNATSIPEGEDDDSPTSPTSPPEDDAGNDGASARQTIASVATMTSQAALVMLLVKRA